MTARKLIELLKTVPPDVDLQVESLYDEEYFTCSDELPEVSQGTDWVTLTFKN